MYIHDDLWTNMQAWEYLCSGVCDANAATHGEAESFEQSGVQCFEDLRRSVEIAEASSRTPAASHRYPARWDHRDKFWNSGGESYILLLWSKHVLLVWVLFRFFFKKKVNLSHLWKRDDDINLFSSYKFCLDLRLTYLCAACYVQWLRWAWLIR